MLKINTEQCQSCAGCISICPEMVLYLDLDNLKVDIENCTLCRFCVRFCPVTAITISGEVKTTGEKTA